MMKKYLSVQSLFWVLVIICFLLVAETVQINKKKQKAPEPDTLTRIIWRGKLRFITTVNAYSYYRYKDQPLGIEYLLAKRFADHLGVSLQVVTPSASKMLNTLEKDGGDIIAEGAFMSREDKKMLLFSRPYAATRHHVVHHRLIYEMESVNDLGGKRIHVRKNSPSHERLMELQNRGQGIDFEIIVHEGISPEDLIRQVQKREIKYAVTNTNITRINRRYYPDIVMGLAISPEMPLRWAVRKKDKKLMERINRFFELAEIKGLVKKLTESYYGKVDLFDYYDVKTFHERIQTRLPDHQEFIMKESEQNGFDWRLATAVVYQESHFDPWAESYTGVKGLMQVTTETALEMGIGDRIDPEQSVRAGIRYLRKLYQRFSDLKDPHQRLLFALASYNVGYGHVRDAQAIATSIGMPGNSWSSLRTALPLLTQRRYYKKTKYGYARGHEPVRYVDKVLMYYDILRHKSVFPIMKAAAAG